MQGDTEAIEGKGDAIGVAAGKREKRRGKTGLERGFRQEKEGFRDIARDWLGARKGAGRACQRIALKRYSVNSYLFSTNFECKS